MAFRFAHLLGSSGAEVLGFKIYGGNPPRPIKWLHRKLLRLRDAKWAFAHRYIRRHQYNRIETGLAPGYYDVDYRMLHGCMNLLVLYVEHEHGGVEQLKKFTAELRAEPDPHASQACDFQAARQDEVLAIYHWWTVERPANRLHKKEWSRKLFSGKLRTKEVRINGHTFHEMLPTPETEIDNSMGSRNEYYAYEDKLDDDDQKMLHRLIDVRRSLWT